MAISDQPFELVVVGLFAVPPNIEPTKAVRHWDGTTWTDRSAGLASLPWAVTYHEGELYVASSSSSGTGMQLSRWNGSRWESVAQFPDARPIRMIAGSQALGFDFAITIYSPSIETSIVFWQDGTWHVPGEVLRGGIGDLHIFDGELYVCGRNLQIDGVPRTSILKWTGSGWMDVAPGAPGGVTHDLATRWGPTGPNLIAVGEYPEWTVAERFDVICLGPGGWQRMVEGVVETSHPADTAARVGAFATQFDGVARVAIAGSFDQVGGVSAQRFTIVTPCEPSDFGDLTGDGLIDAQDLTALLLLWGPCPPEGACAADLDGDGMVGFSDLLILLAHFAG